MSISPHDAPFGCTVLDPQTGNECGTVPSRMAFVGFQAEKISGPGRGGALSYVRLCAAHAKALGLDSEDQN